jgi:outer membrane protein assembly factor BamB
VLDPFLIIVLVGLPFVFVLAGLPWIRHDQASFLRQRAPRLLGILFLVALASCRSPIYRGTSINWGPATQGRARETVHPVTLPRNTLSPTPTALQSSDWPTYHHDNSRTGYLPNEPDPNQLIAAWTTKLDNAVYAEPLVIGNRVIVATVGDSIYSLDTRTGNVQWRTNVGQPVPLSSILCRGTVDPLGIIGTPVYDPATGLVFAVAEVTGPKHVLVGVDLNTGKLRLRRSVDVPALAPPRIYMQRPALALSRGMVYMAFGSSAPDCGQYHGTIVAARTDGQGPLFSYQVPSVDQAGIWGPSGPAIDAEGQVYVATGDDESVTGKWDLSNAVLRLSPTLQLEDSFAPSNWLLQDTGNQDLGSEGPALLPGGLVFIAGKSGDGYLLHANALGGIGGQAATVKVCYGLAMGGAASTASDVFVPCSDGLRRVLDPAGAALKIDWHTSEQINLPPIVGGHTVYSLDPGGILYALDTETGLARAKLSLGVMLPHFATPTLSRGRIFVGTMVGVSAVTLA